MKRDSEETAETADQPDEERQETLLDDQEDRPAQKQSDEDDDGDFADDVERVALVRAALEAVFFAADEPLSRRQLEKVLPDVPESLLDRALRQLELDFAGPMRGIHLALVAGGWQFRTNPDLQAPVLRLFESRPTRLSKAALETLAIVAYRQPVTRAIVDEIRGVDCGGVLKTLQDYDLVTVVGKMDDIGRPNLYGTTDRFLEFFGLASIEDLPTLEDFEVDSLELLGEDLQQLADEMELEALDTDETIDKDSASYHDDDDEPLPQGPSDEPPPEQPAQKETHESKPTGEESAPFPTLPSDRNNEDEEDGDTQ